MIENLILKKINLKCDKFNILKRQVFLKKAYFKIFHSRKKAILNILSKEKFLDKFFKIQEIVDDSFYYIHFYEFNHKNQRLKVEFGSQVVVTPTPTLDMLIHNYFNINKNHKYFNIIMGFCAQKENYEKLVLYHYFLNYKRCKKAS